MEKSFENHPAYEEEDLEIQTPEELEEAKKEAGVAKNHKEVLERLKGEEGLFYISISNMRPADYDGPFKSRKEAEEYAEKLIRKYKLFADEYKRERNYTMEMRYSDAAKNLKVVTEKEYQRKSK